MDDNDFGDFGSDPYEFANVIGDGDQPVYPGCRKYTKLSALVKLYNLKAKHGMSDVCFTELLILQGDLLPEGNTIPTSMRQRAAFNGKPEYGTPPEPLTGEEVLHMVEDGDRVCWKKKSIFFDLEYWKYLPVRHALDVMHIEKNVCDSIIGYSSNIKNLVSLQDSRLLGLKLHDCHTLMQQLLPVAIRSVLEKPARYAITRLCFFFNAICAKTVDVSKLDKLEEDVVVTLCLLEKYFPPSFFDIMVHLVVHLVREVRICGPVYFRWMYPFERYMKVLKGYIQNRTRPEGCIAKRYIAEEAIEFCTEHLSDVSTVGVPSSQKMGVSKPLSGCTVSVVDQDLLNQAHLYVLENTEEVLPYIEQHMIHIKIAYPKFRKRKKWLQDKHNSTFIQWLCFKVQSELEEDNHGVSENLRWLAAGPNMAVPLYRSYLIKDSSGLVVDELGFTLVDLSKIGHRNDQFVLASQVKQVFFVDDPMHRGWSVVLSMPNREYNDVIGDEVLGDVIIECEPFTRGMPNVDTFDELVGAGAPSLLSSHSPHISYDRRSLSNAPEHRLKPATNTTTKRPCSSGREPDGRDQFLSQPQSFD
ncbi:unnamed protein product [Prunus brigantina]